MPKKLFIIRKWVKAKDIQDAILKEKKQTPDDVYIDEDWKRANSDISKKHCGF